MAKIDTKESLRKRIIATVGDSSKHKLIAYHLSEIAFIIKSAIYEIYLAVK